MVGVSKLIETFIYYYFHLCSNTIEFQVSLCVSSLVDGTSLRGDRRATTQVALFRVLSGWSYMPLRLSSNTCSCRSAAARRTYSRSHNRSRCKFIRRVKGWANGVKRRIGCVCLHNFLRSTILGSGFINSTLRIKIGYELFWMPVHPFPAILSIAKNRYW